MFSLVSGDASPPPEATSAIRRTHSDTTDVRKPVFDELYRTTEPTVPPKASLQDSSGRKVKTGDYRPPSPILPMSLLSRIANAFVGLHSHAVYKR